MPICRGYNIECHNHIPSNKVYNVMRNKIIYGNSKEAVERRKRFYTEYPVVQTSLQGLNEFFTSPDQYITLLNYLQNLYMVNFNKLTKNDFCKVDTGIDQYIKIYGIKRISDKDNKIVRITYHRSNAYTYRGDFFHCQCTLDLMYKYFTEDLLYQLQSTCVSPFEFINSNKK